MIPKSIKMKNEKNELNSNDLNPDRGLELILSHGRKRDQESKLFQINIDKLIPFLKKRIKISFEITDDKKS